MAVLLGGGMSALAATYHVAPDGDDQNPGSADQPWRSLAKAQQEVRAQAGKEALEIVFADGIYYLPETVRFGAQDSGTSAHPVVYRAENEGGAVLSGGMRLALEWQATEGGRYEAQTPAGLEIDQLFINGEAQRMARYPNYNPELKDTPYQGFAADAFSPERAKQWSNPEGGYIHAMHSARWGGYHYRITGKNTAGEVQYEGGWQNNRQMGMHAEHRMVENIYEELDAPGEWYHDQQRNVLSYIPTSGTDLNQATVEVVRLKHLVEFSGTDEAPVQHLRFQGFIIRHAARTFMETKEPLLRSDWAIYRGGAFLILGAESITLQDLEFDQVGGNAVFVNHYARKIVVKGCHIHHTGGSGVCFVGDPAAVRNPLFEYNEMNDLSQLDLTPGPQTHNYPSSCVVEDCLITNIGTVERQPAGVQISMASHITVRDCSVYDCARAGINISEGTWGGHLIEGCDVFDTVLETHDHGSFNSWGRDRFWTKIPRVSQEAIDENPQLPFLDAIHTTVIRNSRWRCDHGWDIDLDDGSTNYEIYNNLMLHTGLKLREGFRRYAYNNVSPYGSLHPHVWYQGSGDKVYANIFGRGHAAARMAGQYVKNTYVDRNLFTIDQQAVEKAKRFGWGSQSVFADPMYVDPENGDFRVREGSPALALGFKNFPMDQFGVKKPSLNAIARTPKIYGAKTVAKAAARLQWHGAELKEISGDEFSAYGVSKEQAGVALVDLKDGALYRAGLEIGDLIQQVNGAPTPTMASFIKASKGQSMLVLQITRNQQQRELKLNL